MKIVYVTACLPHGTDEAFIIPEVRQLRHLGHDVLVIPRSLRGPILHGSELLDASRREALYSPQVWNRAARVAINAPAETAAAVLSLCGGRSPGVSLKNLAVVPKALWLADVAARWEANHIHCHWGGTTATMTLLASKVSGIPWSLTVHRWDIVENNLLADKIRSASFTRFISEDGLRMARALGVVSDGKVGVLRMGVELPHNEVDRKRPGNVVLCPARRCL